MSFEIDEGARSSSDIGYIQGSHMVTIKSKEYLLEVWSIIVLTLSFGAMV